MKPTSVVGCAVTFIAIIVGSCRNSGRELVFPEITHAATRQLDFDSVYLKYPYRVKLADSTLYVLDLHPFDYVCHQFDFPSMDFQRSFGKIGKGPEELLNVTNFIVANEEVYLLESYNKRISVYNGNDIKLFANLPNGLINVTDFTLYNDSVFIIPDRSGKDRIIFINRQGQIIHRLGTIPGKEEKKRIPDVALGYAWRPFIHYNPSNNLLVLATQLGEVLEIYNLQTNESKVIVGQGGEPKCRYEGTRAVPIGIMGYWDVFVGKKNIHHIWRTNFG